MSKGPHTTTWPIDWSQIVLELRKYGWPTSRVARHLGRCDLSLYRLANGEVREPQFGYGMDLLLLYRQVTRREPPMFGEVA